MTIPFRYKYYPRPKPQSRVTPELVSALAPRVMDMVEFKVRAAQYAKLKARTAKLKKAIERLERRNYELRQEAFEDRYLGMLLRRGLK